jgi:hypothetical protein
MPAIGMRSGSWKGWLICLLGGQAANRPRKTLANLVGQNPAAVRSGGPRPPIGQDAVTHSTEVSKAAHSGGNPLQCDKRQYGRAALFLLRTGFPSFEVPAGTDRLQGDGLSAPTACRLSPSEDCVRSRVPAGLSRQSPKVANEPSGLLAAIPRRTSGRSRTQPPATADS